jgi:hypothetical protein
MIPLSSVQSLYDCRAEVFIMPGTPDAYETHARPIEVCCQSGPSALLTELMNPTTHSVNEAGVYYKLSRK